MVTLIGAHRAFRQTAGLPGLRWQDTGSASPADAAPWISQRLDGRVRLTGSSFP